MIIKRQSLEVKQRRSVIDFFHRSQEVFERKFDGFPAVVEAPSRTASTSNQSDPTAEPLDISGYLTDNDIPPCPDNPGCADCAEGNNPAMGGPDDWIVDANVNPNSLDFLVFGDTGITFSSSSLSDAAAIYRGFNTGSFPWSYQARVTITGGTLTGADSGLHITTGVSTIAPPYSISADRRSIEIHPRGSAGANDIPVGTPYLMVATIDDNPLGNDKSQFAVPGSMGMQAPYDFFIKVDFLGSGSQQIQYRAWIVGLPEPTTPIVAASGGITGDRFFFLRFDGGNDPGTIIISESVVSGIVFGGEECDNCGGETVTSTLIEVDGTWGPSPNVGTVNYYVNVWFDGLAAVEGIDYTVVNGKIVPIYPLDSGVVVKARYTVS